MRLWLSITVATVPTFAGIDIGQFSGSWPTATRGLTSILLTLLALGIIGMVVYELLKTFRQKKEEQADAMSQFAALSQSLSLNSNEIRFLERIYPASTAKHPVDLIRKLEYFEIGIASEIAKSKDNILLVKNLCDTIAGLRRKLEFDRIPAGTPYYSSRELSSDQEISLTLVGVENPVRYRSRIRYSTEIDLSVDKPKSDEGAPLQFIGKKVRIAIYKPGDGEYSFDTKVLGNTQDNLGLFLEHVVGVSKKQLREYVRLEVRNQTKYRFIKSDKNPERMKGGTRFAGTILDISGGGCLLESAEEYHSSDVIMLSFNFMGEAFYGIKGKILRLNSKTLQTGKVFRNHIQFTEIENNVRERIIRLIFEKQREEVQWQRAAPGL